MKLFFVFRHISYNPKIKHPCFTPTATVSRRKEVTMNKTLNFRLLRADEIEVRVGIVKQNGLSLLLYQDARCGMNLLDETVGPLNWQKHYSRDNANCTISIWDEEKQQWISKEDTGTESNSEAEKGLASDSFKRCCICWNIGRELYTAPFIWIRADLLVAPPTGKSVKDHFKVVDIQYNDKRRISYLVIKNLDTQKIVFTYGKKNDVPEQPTEEEIEKTIEMLKKLLRERCIPVDFVEERFGVSDLKEVPLAKLRGTIKNMEKVVNSWTQEFTEGKTEEKEEEKTEVTTEQKTEPATEQKTEQKTETKTETKTEAKTEAKTETKTEDKKGKTTEKKTEGKRPRSEWTSEEDRKYIERKIKDLLYKFRVPEWYLCQQFKVTNVLDIEPDYLKATIRNFDKLIASYQTYQNKDFLAGFGIDEDDLENLPFH